MANNQNNEAMKPNAGGETSRLRLYFLAPLTLVIMTAIGLFVFEFYSYQQEDVQGGVIRVRTSASDLYQNSIGHNAAALQSILEVLEKNPTLRTALERGDRARLFEESAPLHAKLHDIFGITHFYFSRADRVNLLRVHLPDRHGDIIERHTTRNAARTGAITHGLELGPLGTFTLRVVAPWYADEEKKRLIGFVELGMEIDHALEEVHDYLGVQTLVLIRKQLLQREIWEAGMRELNRVPDWERFPDLVLSSHSVQTIPDALLKNIRQGMFDETATGIMPSHASFRTVSMPMHDVTGMEVGKLILLVDISREAERAHKAVILSSMTALTAGVLLFGLFYWLVGKIGSQLEGQRRALMDLAMRDGLTKLLNHRMFYTLLEKEVARAQRHDKLLSVLMLDIDHFKRVNDTYGHVAGDMILEGLSGVVSGEVRNTDSACRYGGEEISVILPETGMEAAAQLAERIRYAIESHRFESGQGQEINITASIGIASLPAQETSVEKLVAMADKALYKAKESGRNRVCRG